jgi:DNA polymerase V
MDSNGMYQLSFFTDHEREDKERRLHAAMLDARTRYGNNAIVKGINLLKGATTIERNTQIGGHKA